jgi:hypothetical protein
MYQRLDVQLVDGPILDLVVVAAVRLVRIVGLAIAELAQLASKFLALFGRHRTGRLARPSSFGGLDGPPDPPASARRGGGGSAAQFGPVRRSCRRRKSPLLTYVSCLAALRADRLFPVNRADRSDGAPAFRGDNASMTARILRRSIRTCSSVSMPRWFVTWQRV